MIDYNECNYSPGDDKHSYCKHTHYCIFNPKVIQLENSIHSMQIELHYRNKCLQFIKKEGTHNCADYEQTRKRIKILNEDLNRLKKFKNNIIEKEMRGYGFIQL